MKDDIENNILSSCDEVFPEVIDFTCEMVKQYAVLNQEQEVLNIVENNLQELKMLLID